MTTPESLALLICTDNGEYFKKRRYIIIDELHALMASKRGDLLSLGLAQVARWHRKRGLSACRRRLPILYCRGVVSPE